MSPQVGYDAALPPIDWILLSIFFSSAQPCYFVKYTRRRVATKVENIPRRSHVVVGQTETKYCGRYWWGWWNATA